MDGNNKRTAVVIDLKILKAGGEAIDDLVDVLVAESRNEEESIPFDKLVKSLKKKGKLWCITLLTIRKSAAKEIELLPSKILKPVIKAISELSSDPRPKGCKKLKGQTSDFYRIRVGNYRVVYAIDDTIKIIDVKKVGHRKDVYN